MALKGTWSAPSFRLPGSLICTLFFLVTLHTFGTSTCAIRSSAGDRYLIGVGKADITGPVVEIGFAGYANLDQVGSGLRQRLHSRAFIVADRSRPDDRFVYLVLDAQSGDTAVRYGVLDALRNLGDEYHVYGHNNVALTGTHSHAGPGAWFNYLLPTVTTLGFDRQSYQALVDGAVLSIQRAHESLQEGYLDTGSARIDDGAINRSLFAYLANPESERSQFQDDTDTTMTLLRFKRASDNKDIGVLTWFAVHGTSLLGNNTHAAADNKGVAAWLFENAMQANPDAADGFVAGFSQASVGDTTPNVLGAYCDDGTGQQCSLENSTCADGKSQSCHGRGPEFGALDLGVKSCYEMGRRQFVGAQNIYTSLESSGIPIVGPTVKGFHFFHDMRFWNFTLPNGKQAQTCPAALGYSFAAGTSDWPGAFDFTQGNSGKPNASPIWRVVSGLFRTPTKEQVRCQGSKPILLDVGEVDEPYAWTPNIVDIQTLRVGQFVIIVSSSEATTMSGRRWKAAVAREAASFLNQDPIVVLGGPANSYSHYVTTPEEYGVQRYEGASTLFGPRELDAYINLTVSNMHYLRPDSNSVPDQGVLPPDNRDKALSLVPGVFFDGSPVGSWFGKLLKQPDSSYTLGSVVNATFQAANPRNNLRQQQTFAAVEQQGPGGDWEQVRDDNDWFLVYTWRRTNLLLGYSEVDISWETYGNARPGTYRIRYYGDSKPAIGSIEAFAGTSNSFVLA
ncbi:neutral ceramidase precursor [Moelleriella libera RCEF 2490]|uniref:Neutral ceramidase n=1 Tax=Moelleriella libera RCEF 2490 TaxID=1081109 RepID=A0A168CMK8_9HYPO|nr:neutral ceramidase precursor [Moelleriella libera RCEF 2490]